MSAGGRSWMRRKRPAEARHVILLVPRESRNLAAVLVRTFAMLAGISMLGPMVEVVQRVGFWPNLWPTIVIAFMLCVGICLLQGVALQSLFRPERLLLTETGLTAHVMRRRYRADWSQIADVVVHDVPILQRTRVNYPRVTVRLHTPLGTPIDWLEISDSYEVGRHAIGEELRRWHEDAAKRHGGPPDFSLAKAAIVKRDRRLIWAALVIPVPLLILLLQIWLLAGR